MPSQIKLVPEKQAFGNMSVCQTATLLRDLALIVANYIANFGERWVAVQI